MMPDYKVTLYRTPNPRLFVEENLENFNTGLGSLYFEPLPLLEYPFRLFVELVHTVLHHHLLLAAWL